MPSNSTIEGVNNGSTEDRASISSIALLDQVARLKKLYELSMTLAGDPIEVFRHVARLIGELLNVKVVCLSEVRGSELYFLAVYVDGQIFSDAGRCPLEITPCATVEQSKDFRVYDRVRERFPEATFLAQHNAFSYCGFPALDNNGNVVAVTCLLDDKPHDFTSDDEEILRIFGQRIGMEIERHKHIETRKQSEQMVRASEEHYHLLARLAPVGIFRTDAEGHCTYVNQRWCDIAGIDPEQAYGEGWARAIHPDDRKHIFERWYATAKNDQPFMEECRMQRPDGATTWVLAQASAEREVDGRLTGYVGTITDITERKQAEEELLIKAQLLDNANDSIFVLDFAGNLSMRTKPPGNRAAIPGTS